MTRTLLALILLCGLPQTLLALGPDPLPLWPNGAPLAQGSDEADTPTLRAYLPDKDKATGAAIVICPGGGYGILAMDHEGHQVAKWLASKGVAGFVLRYRHAPKYRHPVPLNDAQRAIRYVRAKAADFGVAPGRVGILGFSAGGHLASTVATHFDAGDAKAEDVIDRQSCRPDFAVLCYAVVNFLEPWAHRGSAKNLLGDKWGDEALLKSLCNDTQVTKETPPTFLFHTGEDPGVPVENALAFYSACRKHGVPAELHVYQDGPHGVGLSPADPAVFGWKDRLHAWMQSSNLLSGVARSAVNGKITVDGKPLRWGMIALIPNAPHQPRAWAMVSNGSYSIPVARGAAVGINTVEVHDLGGVEPRPTTEDMAIITKPGQLVLKVVEGANTFDLSLTR